MFQLFAVKAYDYFLIVFGYVVRLRFVNSIVIESSFS